MDKSICDHANDCPPVECPHKQAHEISDDTPSGNSCDCRYPCDDTMARVKCIPVKHDQEEGI
jgi:hypothetical protein